MEYIRKKFTLGRDNKLELRLDTPLELQGNNWYCGLREFSLEQKWSLANEDITIYYQNGHNAVVKPEYYHSVAHLDNILDELFVPLRVKRGGRKALDRMAGIRRGGNRAEAEEDDVEEEAEDEEAEGEEEAQPETAIKEAETKIEHVQKIETATKTEPVQKSTTKTEPEQKSATKTEPVQKSTTKTEPVQKSTTKTEPEQKSATNEAEKKEEAVPAKKQKVDTEDFESDFRKVLSDGEVNLIWIPQEGHFPEPPSKIYAKPVSIEKIGSHAEVVPPSLPVAEPLLGRQEIPKAPDISILEKYLKEGEKVDENKATDKTVDNKEAEHKPVPIPSQHPIPSAPKPLPEPLPTEEPKKEETNIVIPAPSDDESDEDQTIIVDDQRGIGETAKEDKKSDLLEGEPIVAEPAKVKVEPKEEKNYSFFPEIKQDIVKEEVKTSPEVLEFNKKGYNSIRISKNVDNFYTITFDPTFVAAISLSDGFAKALGFTKTSITTNGDIATEYSSTETDISHICMSVNDILRPLNDEKTAEIGIIPINDHTKAVHEYFANPLWFKLETTRINLLSVEFKDFYGNPIACDNAHGHFALVFVNHKR